MSIADLAPALTDPETAPPEGLVDPQARPAGARFEV